MITSDVVINGRTVTTPSYSNYLGTSSFNKPFWHVGVLFKGILMSLDERRCCCGATKWNTARCQISCGLKCCCGDRLESNVAWQVVIISKESALLGTMSDSFSYNHKPHMLASRRSLTFVRMFSLIAETHRDTNRGRQLKRDETELSSRGCALPNRFQPVRSPSSTESSQPHYSWETHWATGNAINATSMLFTIGGAESFVRAVVVQLPKTHSNTMSMPFHAKKQNRFP